MFDFIPPHDPTPEDRLACARWAPGVAIVHGFALLLALGIGVLVKSQGATGIADVPAAQRTLQQADDDNLSTASIAPIGVRAR